MSTITAPTMKRTKGPGCVLRGASVSGLIAIVSVALIGCGTPRALNVDQDINSTSAGGDVYKQVQHPKDRPGMNPKDLVAAGDAALSVANERIRAGCVLREQDRLVLNPKGPAADSCTGSTPPPVP